MVLVSFNLLSINELDEVRETLKTTGYLEVLWKDEFLTWTPADYGGLTYAFFPQDDVWKPDVALKNSVVEYKELGVSTLNVQVVNTGDIVWYPFQVCSLSSINFIFLLRYQPLSFGFVIHFKSTSGVETYT